MASLAKLTSREAVERAINEAETLGRDAFLSKYGFGRAREFFLQFEGNLYDSKAIVGAAYGYQFPTEGPLKHSDFSGGEKTVQRKLEELGFEFTIGSLAIDQEVEFRRELWDQLNTEGSVQHVEPQHLRALGVYSGQQGIWVDKKRTGPLAPDGNGIAVSVLHKGDVYADDLSDDSIIYHFPSTNRSAGRDQSETNALHNAHSFQVPVFILTESKDRKSTREVHLGQIVDWDDTGSVCLIEFNPDPIQEPRLPSPKEPFEIKTKRSKAERTTNTTKRSTAFRFDCKKMYGTECFVCDVALKDCLEAAHIVPVSKNGSDDYRNGLVLCVNHHRLFDKAYFDFNPDTSEVRSLKPSIGLKELAITKTSLAGLKVKPHRDALMWRYKENSND